MVSSIQTAPMLRNTLVQTDLKSEKIWKSCEGFKIYSFFTVFELSMLTVIEYPLKNPAQHIIGPHSTHI